MAAVLLGLDLADLGHIGGFLRGGHLGGGQQVGRLIGRGLHVPLAALFGGAVVEQGHILAVDVGSVHHSHIAAGGAAGLAGPHHITDLDVLGVISLHCIAVLGGRDGQVHHIVAQGCQDVGVLDAGPAAGGAGVHEGGHRLGEADGVALVIVQVPVQGGANDSVLVGIRGLGVHAVGAGADNLAVRGDLHRLVAGGPLGGLCVSFLEGMALRVHGVLDGCNAALGGIGGARNAVHLSAACIHHLLGDGLQRCTAHIGGLVGAVEGHAGDGIAVHRHSGGDDAAEALALAGEGLPCCCRRGRLRSAGRAAAGSQAADHAACQRERNQLFHDS